ncbi:MAG: hypothetical protein QG599_312 [Pseudomonadota bacterium]|nr:hypothetical protein [Pseudomonadota bacterium]
MAKRYQMSLMVLALSSGWMPWASAQQSDSAPPAYPPPLREPPLLYGSPRQPPPEGDIQPYTQPGGYEPAPVVPPRTMPYSGSAAMPPEAEWAMDSGPGWLPASGLIEIQESQGIRYASGGIGEGERAELNALSAQFSLRLLFAMQGSGDYLADVGVNIMDARGGIVLKAQSRGPWFFAQLPPGAYTVDVEAVGQMHRQAVRIGGRQQSRLNFYWR